MSSSRIRFQRLQKPQKSEHKFTHDELKRLFTVGDVEERAIVQLGVNLGFRVEDFATLPREPFERAVQLVKSGKATCPYELKIQTGKEKVVAYCQLCEKTIDVLSTYLQTKQTSNFLFSVNHRDKPITARQLNYMLKRLWEKSYPEQTDESEKIYWHLLRKYLITSCINSGIDTTATKLIVGKSVGTDLTTYLQQVNLSEEFAKVLPLVELGSFIRLVNHEDELKAQVNELETTIATISRDLQGYKTALETVTKKLDDHDFVTELLIQQFAKSQGITVEEFKERLKKKTIAREVTDEELEEIEQYQEEHDYDEEEA